MAKIVGSWARVMPAKNLSWLMSEAQALQQFADGSKYGRARRPALSDLDHYPENKRGCEPSGIRAPALSALNAIRLSDSMSPREKLRARCDKIGRSNLLCCQERRTRSQTTLLGDTHVDRLSQAHAGEFISDAHRNGARRQDIGFFDECALSLLGKAASIE